jgi:hypothetical protein
VALGVLESETTQLNAVTALSEEKGKEPVQQERGTLS